MAECAHNNRSANFPKT